MHPPPIKRNDAPQPVCKHLIRKTGPAALFPALGPVPCQADRDAAQGGRTVAAAQEALAVMEQQLKEREAAEARLLERLETAERALVAAEEDRTRSDAAARELREALGRRDAEAQAAGAELQRAQAQARAAEADLRGQERAAAEAEQRLREALEAQGDEAAKLRALVQQQKAAEELLLQRQQSLEVCVCPPPRLPLQRQLRLGLWHAGCYPPPRGA